MRRDQVAVLAFAAVLASALAVSALSGSPLLAGQPKEPVKDDVATLKELQKERIDTLDRLVKFLSAQYKAGTVGVPELLTAESELVDAKLDFSDKPEERIALLEAQVETAKKTFELVKQRWKTGLCTESDVERAKAHSLDVQIKLARERIKQKPASTIEGR